MTIRTLSLPIFILCTSTAASAVSFLQQQQKQQQQQQQQSRPQLQRRQQQSDLGFGNPITPSWHALHCSAIATVGSNKYLFVYGGISSASSPSSSSPRTSASTAALSTASSATSDVLVFDIGFSKWYEPSSITSALPGKPSWSQSFHSCVTVPGTSQIVVYAPNSGANSTGKTNLQIVDINHWTWSVPSSQPTSPQARLGASFTFATASTNVTSKGNSGMIYSFGGITTESNGTLSSQSSFTNGLHTLDPTQLSWSYASNGLMRAYHAACHLPRLDLLLVFGGADVDKSAYNDVNIYNTSSKQWTLRVPTKGSAPSERVLATAVCLADTNQMVLFGGAGTLQSDPSDSTVWVLTVSTTEGSSDIGYEWSRANIPGANQALGPAPRAGHSAVLDANKMYVFGGYGPVQNGDLYVLDMSRSSLWMWSVIPGGGSAGNGASGGKPAVDNNNGGNGGGADGPSASVIGALCGSIGGVFILGMLAVLCFVRHKRRREHEMITVRRTSIETESAVHRPPTKHLQHQSQNQQQPQMRHSTPDSDTNTPTAVENSGGINTPAQFEIATSTIKRNESRDTMKSDKSSIAPVQYIMQMAHMRPRKHYYDPAGYSTDDSIYDNQQPATTSSSSFQQQPQQQSQQQSQQSSPHLNRTHRGTPGRSRLGVYNHQREDSSARASTGTSTDASHSSLPIPLGQPINREADSDDNESLAPPPPLQDPATQIVTVEPRIPVGLRAVSAAAATSTITTATPINSRVTFDDLDSNYTGDIDDDDDDSDGAAEESSLLAGISTLTPLTSLATSPVSFLLNCRSNPTSPRNSSSDSTTAAVTATTTATATTATVTTGNQHHQRTPSHELTTLRLLEVIKANDPSARVRIANRNNVKSVSKSIRTSVISTTEPNVDISTECDSHDTDQTVEK